MRVVFIGTGAIGVPALEHLASLASHTVAGVVTQPDRPAGRQQKPLASPVKEAALNLHLPIYQPETVNSPAALAQLRYLAGDAFVVIAYGQILSPAVLSMAPRGCINVHASLLPKYRGASPIQAAIANGERYSGLTTMFMDAGLDTGDMILQARTVIRRHDTAAKLHDRLAQMAPALLEKTLDLLETGEAPRSPQDPAEASYAKKLRKEDGHIDWNLSQRAVDCHIRAMLPWPGAFSWIHTAGAPKMLKIHSTILSNRASGRPGEVVRVDEHGILVAARVGGLLLRQVQLEGKRAMRAADFARGFNLPAGTRLE